MSEKAVNRSKLGLHLPTDPRWVNLTMKSLEDILTDHAFCELKAATTCISIIQQYPDKVSVVDELSPVVTEEWDHFNLVLQELKLRNLRLGRQRKDEYVNRLMKIMKKGGSRDERLVEKLLVCALIEARSAERFRLLSLHLEDENLKEFYHNFMVSEAGHYKMFLALAKEYGGKEKVLNRWQEILQEEAKIIESLEVRGDRMH